MVSSQQKTKSPVMESAFNFVLGAVAGGTLGAIEVPVNQAMTEIISGTLIKPITDGMKTVGALGLGTILGATALTTSITSIVLGVTMAASVGLLLLRVVKSEGWAIIGLVAALAMTSSGAAMGAIIEQLVRYGVVSLLWALGIFTVLKLLMHTVVRFACREWDCCGSLENSNEDSNTEQERLDALKEQQRQRVAVEIEQRIITLEMEKTQEEKLEDRSDWKAQQRQREKIEKQYQKAFEVEMKHRTSQQHLRKVIAKYMEFWAFSGIPMTVTASVTAGFGIFGFGAYRFVFVILIVLVLCMSFGLMRSRHLTFWMFIGCMTMFATFAIAVLTVHAGQEVAGMSVKMRRAGQEISKENISFRMTHTSSVEAISAGFFVTKVCQVGLGATVGGPLAQEIDGKAVVGASVVAVFVLMIVRASPLILGAGGTAGALLGVVGAAGVSMGAAAAVAGKSSSWVGTIVTIAGMIFGLLIFGRWDFVNTGLQISVAYIFAMTNLH
ncbi:uncharacterized protein LOC130570207 [Triplophysa rosa]|uniref:Uncharacterized protein n=1 Tax=Triplophysa rosa TaxID=992332 RepID=A0A9W7WE76_TRIRA|nr:uncharacterized protein LOC130570207 [Triplophysa rosa]KAI7795799.1 hypothetical protein IRJ41_006756 [Triplophysa rosa]